MHYTRAAPPLFSPYRTKARAIRMQRRAAMSHYRVIALPEVPSRAARIGAGERAATKTSGYRVPGGAECVILCGASRANRRLRLTSNLEGSQSRTISLNHILLLLHFPNDISFKYIYTLPCEIIPAEYHASAVCPPEISDDPLTCPFDLSLTCSRSLARKRIANTRARMHYLFRCFAIPQSRDN